MPQSGNIFVTRGAAPGISINTKRFGVNFALLAKFMTKQPL